MRGQDGLTEREEDERSRGSVWVTRGQDWLTKRKEDERSGGSVWVTVSVTDKGNRGQPACPEEWKKCKKNMNSSNSVMNISVCPVSHIAVVMFTCTLVRSHPDSRRCWGET